MSWHLFARRCNLTSTFQKYARTTKCRQSISISIRARSGCNRTNTCTFLTLFEISMDWNWLYSQMNLRGISSNCDTFVR
ncbi:hypothetical protein P879_00721 [Paragonimus westermani]|uniref:Uncharacterized protein n=1 Tax=Paragonimus westermani TaxID=34504 RepID=A0A8T0DHT4_9TREM|nr:hypothetical protein P879_00721 [Paragonimus westermani]